VAAPASAPGDDRHLQMIGIIVSLLVNLVIAYDYAP
jgi:hypothetical protein